MQDTTAATMIAPIGHMTCNKNQPFASDDGRQSPEERQLELAILLLRSLYYYRYCQL